jgi:hypothetical protein
MKMDTQVQQRVFVELSVEPSDAAAVIDARLNDADSGRSEKNILQWMSYLPENCVKTMIGLGWDITT